MICDKFEICEKEGKLHVFIAAPFEEENYNIPRFRIDTQDVIKALSEKGITHGPCIKEGLIKNWHKKRLDDEWIFNISIDKVEKRVIIKKEKQVQPKPKTTRKKRTRSSTKKVSTED
tara:strand:- start:24 stop:374 length:351 start_codon:yes stop_codon:yes gene_type:complete